MKSGVLCAGGWILVTLCGKKSAAKQKNFSNTTRERAPQVRPSFHPLRGPEGKVMKPSTNNQWERARTTKLRVRDTVGWMYCAHGHGCTGLCVNKSPGCRFPREPGFFLVFFFGCSTAQGKNLSGHYSPHTAPNYV